MCVCVCRGSFGKIVKGDKSGMLITMHNEVCFAHGGGGGNLGE